jgi:hypothetical protein
MKSGMSGKRAVALVVIAFAAAVYPVSRAWGTGFGRVAGTVTDAEGVPLMGATVVLAGPIMAGSRAFNSAMERVITDAQGHFTVDHLIPGWYSLKVTAATRIPVLRNNVRVNAGQTATETFVLSGVFAPLHIQALPAHFSTWGEDWKWILRTSSATRPILRYQQAKPTATLAKTGKARLPASQKLVGLLPGASRRDALSGDLGYGSVLAYLRPLSDNADVLVAGTMTANGVSASTIATAFRRNISKENPQEVSIVVHQLSFADGILPPFGVGGDRMGRAQGMVTSYTQTRRLSPTLALTAGFEVDYLTALSNAATVQPRIKLEYSVNPETSVTVQYGALHVDSSGTMLDRVGLLNAFPRISLRGYQPRLEELNHAEVNVSRKLGKSSRIEAAAFRDAFKNAAVWGFGDSRALAPLEGNYLPNPVANGVTLNGGDYHSTGFRAAYACDFGKYLEAAVVYAMGDALVPGSGPFEADGRSLVHPERTQSFAGRISATLPKTHTQLTTSYQWLPPGRITGVDPYSQAEFQVQPFFGVQIRQPLPSISFLPAHIEALADFRNLLSQGYTASGQAGEQPPILLTAAYRSFRGGFSVQF